MEKVKVKIINAHFREDEDMLTLNEFIGCNDGDIIEAELGEDGTLFVSDSCGSWSYLREEEFEVVE